MNNTELDDPAYTVLTIDLDDDVEIHAFNDRIHGKGVILRTISDVLSWAFLAGVNAFSISCEIPDHLSIVYLMQLKSHEALSPDQAYSLFSRVVPKEHIKDIVQTKINVQSTKIYQFNGL